MLGCLAAAAASGVVAAQSRPTRNADAANLVNYTRSLTATH